MSASVIVLIIYLAVIFGIGLYNGRAGVKNEEDYYLGDRSFGPLPTAISMGATDSSGWIFIGAIGYAYLAGPVSFWMYPGFAVLIAKLGGWGAFWSRAVAIDPVMGTLTGGAAGSAAVGVILGLLFYGLGEFGQPHILQRFFSAKDDNTLKYGTIVSSLRMIGVMCGSSILGCLARVYIDGLEDAEYAFPTLVNQMMPAVVSTAWYMAGLGAWCMELVPGMIASWLVIEAVGSVSSRRERKI